MADHAVGRVDGLIKRAARQAAERDPEQRRDHAIGEVLRQALQRGAGDARLVERLGIAPDDLGDGRPSRGEAALLQTSGDREDMPIQALLRRQARGQERERREADGPGWRQAGNEPRDDADRAEIEREREDARRAADRERERRPIEPPLQCGDERAHPGDGMPDCAIDSLGIADRHVEKRRGQGER